jgi:hypothetical protein
MNKLQVIELEEIETLDLQAEETKQRFTVTDIDSLNWCLRKLAALEAQQNQTDELAAAEILRINTWKESEQKRIENSEQFFGELIRSYMEQQRAANPKFKKQATPYGTVSFKKQQPKWNYDDKLLVESLKEIGRSDLVRVKEEPDKTALKKVMKVDDGRVVDEETGAILTGVVVVEQPDKLDIKVAE